jgi:hypothetical protein
MKHSPLAISARPLLLPLLLASLLVFSTGCRTAQIREGPVYRAAIPAAETLDIQVFRHQTEIEFTNTTARNFGPGTIWLNRRFGRHIDGLEVGQTVRFPLRDFRDRFGESYRAGGFFAVERPERLVVAELETEQAGSDRVILGLVVVGTGL